MKFCKSRNRINFENLRIVRIREKVRKDNKEKKKKEKKCEDHLHYLNNNVNFKAFVILCKIEQIFKIILFSDKIFS